MLGNCVQKNGVRTEVSRSDGEVNTGKKWQIFRQNFEELHVFG